MAEELDVATRLGRVRVRRFGPSSGVAALCIPGLSSNGHVYDALGEYRESRGRGIVALDLRGRGWSEITTPGTYGWENHARDLFDVAEALGVEQFDLVGHSMGAYISITASAMESAARIRRVVLIDGLGIASPVAVAAIVAGVGRLKGTFASADAYVATVRDSGLAAPWNAYWDRHYRYDLVDEGGSVHPRTSIAAVTEDAAYAGGRDVRRMWPRFAKPALVVRATIPLGAPGGFVLTRADYDAFLQTHPNARGVEVAANHYGAVMDPTTVEAIDNFLLLNR
jgi:pimeloyl-ACP methyl ester carboxylesterase